jgi:hypothetical protein
MSLFLVPSDSSPGDSKVMHGQLLVGQIHKQVAASRAGSEWLWIFDGVSSPEGLTVAGSAATPQEAISALTELWSKWLDWAKLAEKT